MLAEILEERVASSRGRKVPRGVKRKMSGFPTKARAAPSPRRVFRYGEHVKVIPPASAAPPKARACLP